MTTVLGAVERQHARTHDLGGRESGVVDGEATGIAHHLDAEIPARHQPATEGGDPRDRFAFPEACQRAVRIGVEQLERERRAKRGSASPRGHESSGAPCGANAFSMRG